MIKFYLFLLSFLLVSQGFSQQNFQLQEIGNIPLTQSLLANGLNKSVVHKSTACSLDTVQYTFAKATGLNAINMNNATSASAGANYFDAPQDITVSGLEFFAYSITLPSINVNVSIYLAGPDSLPTGAPLANTSVTVDSAFGGGDLNVLRKIATFPVPVTLSAPYLIVVENNSPNNMGLICSDYAAGDGLQEWLAGIQIGANWLRSYAVNVGGPVFDADWIFNPLVTYDLNASFSSNTQCLSPPLTMKTFTNTSSGVLFNRMYNQAAYLDLTDLSCTWDFGDGTPIVNGVDTAHNYTASGPLSVNLLDTLFGWTRVCFDDTSLLLVEAPDADFSSSVNSLQVSFTDASTNLSASDDWFWDFGDGTTSIMENPMHTFPAPGLYTVCLTLSNECGGDTECKSVNVSCAAPEVDFTTTSAAYTASFTSTTTNLFTGSLEWDFGDGGFSFQTNPSHIYATTGVYTVCVIATSPCGMDTSCQSITIVCDNPIADFTSSSVGYDLALTNTSSSSGLTDYLWDFGDGNTSTAANPGTHTYTAAQSYDVCLRVTDACGVDSICQLETIVCDAPVAIFDVQMTASSSYDFTDNSAVTGTATYLWDFGDGISSIIQDENHSYANPGSYTVCLSVTDQCGTDSTCTLVEITTGLNDLASLGVAVLPNPSAGKITIQANQDYKGIQFSVLNNLGQEVFLLEGIKANQVIDLGDLSKGIYFIRMTHNGQAYGEKILIR